MKLHDIGYQIIILKTLLELGKISYSTLQAEVSAKAYFSATFTDEIVYLINIGAVNEWHEPYTYLTYSGIQYFLTITFRGAWLLYLASLEYPHLSD